MNFSEVVQFANSISDRRPSIKLVMQTKPRGMLTSVGATEAREKFAELLGRVAYAKERILLTRNGQEVGVLIPMEDYARLIKDDASTGEGEAVQLPLK